MQHAPQVVASDAVPTSHVSWGAAATSHNTAARTSPLAIEKRIGRMVRQAAVAFRLEARAIRAKEAMTSGPRGECAEGRQPHRTHDRHPEETTWIETQEQDEVQPLEPSLSPISAVKRGKRSRSGCLTCRARKVKCDELPGCCGNCARRGLSCSGYTSGPLSKSMRNQLRAQKHDFDLTEAGLERRRLRASCQACRLGKTKCSGDRPACARCSDKGLHCAYDASTSCGQESLLSWPRRDNSSSASLQDSPVEGIRASSEALALNRNDGTMSEASFQASYVDKQSTCNMDGITQDRNLPRWLLHSSLPSKERVYQLAEHYFANVHPLRCHSFIHRPSFMKRLDQDILATTTGNPLLHVICALGAKFYALDLSNHGQEIEPNYILAAGSQWANVAQSQISSNINHISVEDLMATVLLHDHELRVGHYAAAFMLSGTGSRMCQALQINLEYSTDIFCTEPSSMSFCAREARRRLMWSCYIMDSWVGSGVDQLTLIDDRDVKIQLPCHERNFLHQIPCITETLANGLVLKFIPEDRRPSNPAENMGIAAHFARIAGLRKRILRYIKQIDIKNAPQLPDQEFLSLDASFQEWFDSLSPTLRLSTTSIYTSKDSGQLGALFLLHCAYHISLCDLYRISMPMLLPGLLKTWSSANLSPDQQSFRIKYQRKCFEHAKMAAEILEKAIEHGPRLLADTWLCVCAFESIRTILYYSLQGAGLDQEASRVLTLETIPLFRINMKAIKLMLPLFATAERCYIAATILLRKARIGPQLVEGAHNTDDQSPSSELERPIKHAKPAAELPENVLNPLSIYALTRENIGEKQTEDIASPRPSTRAEDAPRVPPASFVNVSQYDQNQQWRAQDQTSAPAQYSISTTLPEFNSSSSSLVPGMIPTWQQHDLESHMDPFWMTLMSDFDGPWLPAETAQESVSALSGER